MDNKVGKLLIAHPNIKNTSSWYKTVIYVVEDNHTGTKGIILNKPSTFAVSEFLASRGLDFAYTKENMRYGGPIKSSLVTMLHTDHWYSKSTQIVANGISLSYDDFMFEKMCMGDAPNLYRVAVGLSVWQPGQLDKELTGENSWLIADADINIVFSHDGERQWHKSIELSSNQMINQFF